MFAIREPRIRGISIITWIEVMAGAKPDEQREFEDYFANSWWSR